MSLKKKDFYGKEVAEAIKKACEEFDVPQEDLDIEIIETGSTGIFGLIRKKTHIRASVKEEIVEELQKEQAQPATPPVKDAETVKEVAEGSAAPKVAVEEEENGADESTSQRYWSSACPRLTPSCPPKPRP